MAESRLRQITESTWSPLQSPEVREICAHLTPTEHTQLIEDAQQRGKQIGLWLAGPLAIVGIVFARSWRLGLLLLAIYAVYFILSGLPRLRAMRRRTTQLLCNTEWARSQDHTPDRLPLMKFPWSK